MVRRRAGGSTIRLVDGVRMRAFDRSIFSMLNPKLQLWHKRMKSDIDNCFFFVISEYRRAGCRVGYCSADVVLVGRDWLLKLTVPVGTPSYDVIICGALIDQNDGEQLHATVFIADKRSRTVAWYDPHGASQFLARADSRAILNRFSRALRHTFTKFLPPVALNALQIAYKTNYRDVAGYCLYWTFAIVDFYLLNRCGAVAVDISNIGERLRAVIERADDDPLVASRVKRLNYIREYMMYAWRASERFAAVVANLAYKDVNDTAMLRGLYLRDRRFLKFARDARYVQRFARVGRRTDNVVTIMAKDKTRYTFLTNKSAMARLAFFLLHVARVKKVDDFEHEIDKEPWRISLFDSRTTTRIGKRNKRRVGGA